MWVGKTQYCKNANSAQRVIEIPVPQQIFSFEFEMLNL